MALWLKPALLSTALLVTALSPALAADEIVPEEDYVLDLGVGVLTRPAYLGADEYEVAPFPIIGIERFVLPVIGQIGGDEPGFSVAPSFDFIGKRNSADYSDLRGLDDVNWAVELGLKASYRADWFEAFVAVRQGLNGHEGQVADFGFDLYGNLSDEIAFTIGPRATWASDDVMSTYFSVSAAEAAAPGSKLSQYDADAGFRSVGIAARAEYGFTENTTFHLRASWDRLVGDAADSPIVKEGSADQFMVGAGLSYRFAF